MANRFLLWAVVTLSIAFTACERSEPPWVSPIPFDTATAWLSSGADSVNLLVEVAVTPSQRSFGLMERPSLDPSSGMVFQFDSVQAPDAGFWMYRTLVPLDIAYIDSLGTIVSILEMEPCEFDIVPAGCRTYRPGAEYWSTLEVNRGWFKANGIDLGARVRVEPRQPE